jgi:hypothetical protein
MAKRFSGAVNIDVSGQPFVDLASEARMALLRD